MPTLRIQTPGHDPQSVNVPASGATLGRGEDADIFLVEARASRTHARIAPHATGWIVEDLGSSNGTWIDDQRVARRRLPDHGTFRIGETTITLELEAPVVSGSLALVRVDDQPVDAAAEREPEVGPAESALPDTPRQASAARPRPGRGAASRRAERAAITKGAAVLVLGVVAWLGAQWWFGREVETATKRAAAREDALTVVAEMSAAAARSSDGEPDEGSSDAFDPDAAIATFKAKHPHAIEGDVLDRHASTWAVAKRRQERTRQDA